MIECFFCRGDHRVIFLENDMKNKLIAIEIDSATTNLTPENRNIVRGTEVEINLMGNILVITDADIG